MGEKRKNFMLDTRAWAFNGKLIKSFDFQLSVSSLLPSGIN